MAKKIVKKKTVEVVKETPKKKKNISKKHSSKKTSSGNSRSRSLSGIENALLENFVSLQKVLTNLTVKFDDLSSNISKLLHLFEISAKSFAENQGNLKGSQVDADFLKKLDELLDQNKTISKGIMLMEERIRKKDVPTSSENTREVFRARQMPMQRFR